MNWIKSIAFVAIAALLFTGSIGVSIFANSCEKEGVQISYFAPKKNDCCAKESHKTPSNHQNCCSKQKEESKGDCCDVSAELVKMHLDFLNKVHVAAILVQENAVQPIWAVKMPIQTEELLLASGSDPPPKLRQDFLVDIQQWLI